MTRKPVTRAPEIVAYRLEQGMRDPRTPERIGWQYWDEFADRDLALKEARLLAQGSTGIARVLEVRVVETFGA